MNSAGTEYVITDVLTGMLVGVITRVREATYSSPQPPALSLEKVRLT